MSGDPKKEAMQVTVATIRPFVSNTKGEVDERVSMNQLFNDQGLASFEFTLRTKPVSWWRIEWAATTEPIEIINMTVCGKPWPPEKEPEPLGPGAKVTIVFRGKPKEAICTTFCTRWLVN